MPTPEEMREKYRTIVWQHRNLPAIHGLRPHSVAIIDAAWSGAYVGRGDESRYETPLVESGGHNPKVRWLTDEELALGNLLKGVVEIGPITPDFSGGGTSLTMLNPTTTAGETLHLLITGPQHPTGAKYRVTSVGCDRALHYTIRAEPVSTDGPTE
jgi:hypothetical protein